MHLVHQRFQQPTTLPLAASHYTSLLRSAANSTHLGSAAPLIHAAVSSQQHSPWRNLPLIPTAVSSQQHSPWQHLPTHPRCCQQPTALTLATSPHSSPLRSAANSTHLGSISPLISAAISSQQHSPWQHLPTHPRCCQQPTALTLAVPPHSSPLRSSANSTHLGNTDPLIPAVLSAAKSTHIGSTAPLIPTAISSQQHSPWQHRPTHTRCHQQPTALTLTAPPHSSPLPSAANSTHLGSTAPLILAAISSQQHSSWQHRPTHPRCCQQSEQTTALTLAAPPHSSPLRLAANSTHLGSIALLIPAAVSSQQHSSWQHCPTHPRCDQQPTALTLTAPPYLSPLLSADNSPHLGSIAPLIPAAVSSQQHSPWQHRPTHPRCCQQPTALTLAAQPHSSPLRSAANSTHLGSIAPLIPALISSQQHSPWQHRPTHPRCDQQPTALIVAASPHSSPLLSADNSTHLGSTAPLIPAAISSQQHSPWQHRPTHPCCCQQTTALTLAVSPLS